MKLYVGNLPRQITDATLNELAAPYGTVQSASVAVDRSSNESKGFGFIEFNNDDEGRAAMKGLDGKDVEGQVLKVDEARPRKGAVAQV